MSVRCGFPARSLIENEPAGDSVEDSDPPPATADETAFTMHVVEFDWIIDESVEMPAKRKSTPDTRDNVEQSMLSSPAITKLIAVLEEDADDTVRVTMGGMSSNHLAYRVVALVSVHVLLAPAVKLVPVPLAAVFQPAKV